MKSSSLKYIFWSITTVYLSLLVTLVVITGINYFSQKTVEWQTLRSTIIKDNLAVKIKENYVFSRPSTPTINSFVEVEKKVTYVDPDIDEFTKEIFTEAYDLIYTESNTDNIASPPLFADERSREAFDYLPEDYYKSVVTILGYEGYGSGFCIGRAEDTAFIMTNAHVVDQTLDEFIVLSYMGEMLKVNKVVMDYGRDLAVLEVNSQYLQPVELAENPTSMGDGVILVGSPKGQINVVSAGMVVEQDFDAVLVSEDSSENSRFLIDIIDANVKHGDSGGPVFDLEGKLIGTLCCVLDSPGGEEASGGMISYARSKYRIEDYLKNRDFTKYDLGIEDFEVLDRGDLSGLSKTGYKITALSTDSLLAEEGLMEEDIIVAINGKNVYKENQNAYTQLRELEDLIGGGEKIEFTVFKADLMSEYTIKLQL